MRLHHIHLPGLTRYSHVSALQEFFVRAKIAHHRTESPPPAVPVPTELATSPLLITYTAPPTYTSGRRQHRLDSAQVALLQHGTEGGAQDADYVPSPRGGLLTFHGPGQVTAYPILHLRSHKLTPRCYVRLLEDSIIRTLARYKVHGFTRDEYPGVWVSPDRKVASIGVHVQRGVTNFGTGINVSTHRKWWDRFTACGIDGVEMVNLEDLGGRGLDGEDGVRVVGEALAGEMAAGLKGVGEVVKVPAEDITQLLEAAHEKVDGED